MRVQHRLSPKLLASLRHRRQDLWVSELLHNRFNFLAKKIILTAKKNSTTPFDSNQCALASASCRAQGSIGLASGGECRPIVRPATDPPRCSAGCPKILLPVCGSDGKTYANSCLLKLAACQQHKSITIVRQGKCEDPNADPCNIIRCGYGATCQNGKCQCDNACPAVYEPVCGTDGETYG